MAEQPNAKKPRDKAAKKQATTKPPLPPDHPDAQEAPPEPPPHVAVILHVDESGGLNVVDVQTAGLTIDRAQWWLEEGIKFIRQRFEKP